LLENKLIEEVELREDERLGKERRRYYRLTVAGRKLARSEAERLAHYCASRVPEKYGRGLCLTELCLRRFMPGFCASIRPVFDRNCFGIGR
jgi:hypothetical protein